MGRLEDANDFEVLEVEENTASRDLHWSKGKTYNVRLLWWFMTSISIAIWGPEVESLGSCRIITNSDGISKESRR